VLFENWACNGFDGVVEADIAWRGVAGLYKSDKTTNANTNVELSEPLAVAA